MNSNYELLSTSGDHFIAKSYFYKNRRIAVRMEEGLLRKLEVPEALEQTFLTSSNTDPKGNSILVGIGKSKQVTYWKIETQSEAAPETLPIPDIEKIALSPAGDWLATSNPLGISIWTMQGNAQSVLFVPNVTVTFMEFSRDGRNLFIIDAENKLRILSTYVTP